MTAKSKKPSDAQIVLDAVKDSIRTGKRVTVVAKDVSAALTEAFLEDYLHGTDHTLIPDHRKTDDGTEVEGFKHIMGKLCPWSLLIKG